MPKQFYTEKDIEDLVRGGTKSLQVTDDIVLTELAYEKARQLGLELFADRPDNPPAAPVRPYLSEGTSPALARPKPAPAAPLASQPQPSSPDTSAIEQRIRSAVIARLGNQVNSRLLDTIIHRVVKSTGLK